MTKRTAVYAGMGPLLVHYEVDVDGLSLTRRSESVTLPSNVHYTWQHATKPLIYVAGSNRVDRHAVGIDHHLSVLRIDANTGGLIPQGSPMPLSHRPIHLTTDRYSEHLLIAFDTPSELQVYRINEDGSIGERLAQRSGIDFGVFAHQIRISADNQLAILVTRGNPYRGQGAYAEKQEDPGALKVFQYKAGLLGEESSVAPQGGLHFGARFIGFHPTAPWMYLSLETQNKFCVFRREGKRILPDPVWEVDTLATPTEFSTPQVVGTLQVHPNGRIVYCVNRGHIATEYQGKQVLIGVDNSLAVFSIDEATGEPTLIQRIDSGGIWLRAFAIHPSGKLLVVANSESHLVKVGDEVRSVPPHLAVFEIRSDGTLSFARKYDVEPGPGKLWMCMADY